MTGAPTGEMWAGQPVYEMSVQILPHGEGLPLPEYQTTGAAGFDLHAAVDEPVLIPAGQRRVIPCGIIVEVPPGSEGCVRGRSGLGVHHGICISQGVGTVDSDYRGELFVPLTNHSGVGFLVRRGDRIAQMLISPVQRVALVQVDEVSETERGEGGMGSTGRN